MSHIHEYLILWLLGILREFLRIFVVFLKFVITEFSNFSESTKITKFNTHEIKWE